MTRHYRGKTLKTQRLFRLRRKAQRLTAQARTPPLAARRRTGRGGDMGRRAGHGLCGVEGGMIGRLHSITINWENFMSPSWITDPKTWVGASNPSHKDWWNAPQRPLPEGWVVIDEMGPAPIPRFGDMAQAMAEQIARAVDVPVELLTAPVQWAAEPPDLSADIRAAHDRLHAASPRPDCVILFPPELGPLAAALQAIGVTVVSTTEAAALLTSTLPSQEIAPAKISDALFSAQDITAKLPARRKPKHRGPKPHGRWWDR